MNPGWVHETDRQHTRMTNLYDSQRQKDYLFQITLWNHHYLLSPCFGFFFSPNSSFQNFMGTNTPFVLTSVAGWLAASCIELCHESRRQVLLPKRIFCTRSLLQLQSAPCKHFQPIIGRKETCFPTTKNHCGLSNFSGIALWSRLTPFISSLGITQQSEDTQFVPAGCSVKAWTNGFCADECQGFKTWGPHSDLHSWRSGATLKHAWAHVRAAASAFPCLWHCGEPDRQSSQHLLQPVLLPAPTSVCVGWLQRQHLWQQGTQPKELSSCFASSKLPSERTS